MKIVSNTSNESKAKSGIGRLAEKEHGRKMPSKRQDVHMSRAEHEVVSEGGYSWVSDIRCRVGIAKKLSRSDAEFRQVLGLLGIEVSPASTRGGRDDWVYSMRETPMMISGLTTGT